MVTALNRPRASRAIVALLLVLAVTGATGPANAAEDDKPTTDPASGCEFSSSDPNFTCFLQFFFEVQTEAPSTGTLSVMDEAEGGITAFFDEIMSQGEGVVGADFAAGDVSNLQGLLSMDAITGGIAFDGLTGQFDAQGFLGGSPMAMPALMPDFESLFLGLIPVDDFGCPVNGGGPTAAAAAEALLILVEFLHEILPTDVLSFAASAIAAVPVAFAKLPPVIISMQNDLNDGCLEGTHQEHARAAEEARLRNDIAATLASSTNPVAEFLLPSSLGGRLAWFAHDGGSGGAMPELPAGVDVETPGTCADGSRCPGQWGATSPTVQNVVSDTIAALEDAGITVAPGAHSYLARADDALAAQSYLNAFRYYRQAYGYATRV